MLSSAFLCVSVAAWRTMRARRCTWRWNGTMRVRMRPFCNSVMVRACCVSRFCVSLVRFSSKLLDAADVVRGLGEGARELLDRGVAVELQRIEVALLALLFLVAMQDLRFGFELELAQLFLQARDGARQFADVEVDGADLLLETRARNAGLAGIVEQLVEQLGVDARELGPVGRRGRFAARRHSARRQQRRIAASPSLFEPAETVPFAAARVTMDGGFADGAPTRRRAPAARARISAAAAPGAWRGPADRVQHRRLGAGRRRRAGATGAAARRRASGRCVTAIAGAGGGARTARERLRELASRGDGRPVRRAAAARAPARARQTRLASA